MLSVDRINTLSDIESLRKDWDRLAGNNRMRSMDWALAWWNSFPHQCIPYLLTVRDRHGIHGIFPLAMESSALRGRRLILLGSGKACGDGIGILSTPGLESHVACSLGDWMAEACGLHAWDSLDLDGIQPSDPTMSAFLHQLQSVHQIIVTQKASEHCWAIDLQSGWEGVLAGLSKRSRRMVKNNLVAEFIDSGRAKLKVASSLPEARAMLDVTAAFHQSRWNERNIDGCFATKGFSRFLETLVDQWWPQGIAYAATMELDGKAIAGGIGMWGPDELAMYLIGMDIESQAVRPGLLLTVESIRLAISSGKKSFNFLRGDEEYKARMGAKPTVQQRWLATSPRLIPRLRGAALQKGIEVRDWFRNRTKVADPVATEQSLADAST